MSKPFLLPRWPPASQKILCLEFLSIKKGTTCLMKRQIETTEVELWWSLHLHSRKKKLTKSEGTAVEFSACCCCAGTWDLASTLTGHTVTETLARLSLKDQREERENKERTGAFLQDVFSLLLFGQIFCSGRKWAWTIEWLGLEGSLKII